MITPRRIRLLRAPDLAGYRSTLVDLTRALDASTAADTFVLVPTTRGRRTAQRARSMIAPARSPRHRPHIGPRSALVRRADRAAAGAAAAADADSSAKRCSPPARAKRRRPARRRRFTSVRRSSPRCSRSTITSAGLAARVDDFDRLLDRRARAGGRIGSRRGAAARADAIPVGGVSRLRGAARRTAARVDEHGARARLSRSTPRRRRLRHVVVAIGDRPFDPDGYWPADVAMLTTHRRPRVDRHRRDRATCSTRVTSIACGWRSWRSRRPMRRRPQRRVPPRLPVLVVPRLPVTTSRSRYRDREDELEGGGAAHQGRSPARREAAARSHRPRRGAAAAVSLPRARSVCRRGHSVRSARYAAAGRGTLRGRGRCRARMRVPRTSRAAR